MAQPARHGEQAGKIYPPAIQRSVSLQSTRDSAHRWMKVGAQVKDDDDRKVYFFHRGCITPNYLPRKGDHIAFNLRTNPRGGGLEAFNFELLAPA
jgi:hypothetical protein